MAFDRGVVGWTGERLPAHSLGDYELLSAAACGGMALVWAARRKRSSRIVAIKTLLPSLSPDPRFERMFLQEARLSSCIDHDNVCRVVETGEDRGVHFIVMEWIDGDSIAALAGEAGTRLPFDVATRIALDAAHGLHAAHECADEDGQPLGIVHRDVSPQNILVTTDGVAKVTDFGVAKATRATAPTTSPGYVKGKARYLAPEQVYLEGVDRRTDVFALGVVLYELTTGSHPFPAESDVAMVARLASPTPARSPAELVSGYPPRLAEVVSRAVAKDASARWQTMADLAAALETCNPATAADVGAFVRAAWGPRARERAARIAAALGKGGRGANHTRSLLALAIGALVVGAAAFAMVRVPATHSPAAVPVATIRQSTAATAAAAPASTAAHTHTASALSSAAVCAAPAPLPPANAFARSKAKRRTAPKRVITDVLATRE